MTFAELNAKVAAAVLGTVRLTGLKKGTHSIVIDGEVINIVTPQGIKVPVTDTALAAFRTVKAEADAKLAANTRDARTNEKYMPLQKALAAEGIQLSEATKLEVVHNLPIYDSVMEQVVLTNESYKGYPEYIKATRKASAIGGNKKVYTEAEQAERRIAFNEATDALRTSGYKAGITPNEANTVTMPVFMVK